MDKKTLHRKKDEKMASSFEKLKLERWQALLKSLKLRPINHELFTDIPRPSRLLFPVFCKFIVLQKQYTVVHSKHQAGNIVHRLQYNYATQ